MKRQHTLTLIMAVLIGIGLLSVTLSAENKQEYRMDIAQTEHYITISREQIASDNLPLAKVYAQKAIKANPWSAKAWANYDDIVQKLADNGELEDFEAFIERSKAAEAPTKGGGSKFEGC